MENSATRRDISHGWRSLIDVAMVLWTVEKTRVFIVLLLRLLGSVGFSRVRVTAGVVLGLELGLVLVIGLA